jgi:uncharacterized protein YcnI
MKKTTLSPVTIGVGIGAGLLLAVAAPLAANAHVGVTPNTTAAGSYAVLTFAVPHGCDGSATTQITITIPDEIASVTPTVNPGWDVTKVMVDEATPATAAADSAPVQRVGQVVYTAHIPLADGYRDTFALQMPLPEDSAGQTLEFPTLQTCVDGETNWNQSVAPGQDDHSVESPAPSIVVSAALDDSEHGGHRVTTDQPTDTASAAATTEQSSDILARVFGIGGLAIGAVAIVIAAVSIRRNRTN